ncbi:MAG: hypothetical protein ABFC67_04490 [Mizugakiibacter sp.]|uniref:hypothetical protein n=1 Tax=Mizugakiibacter sp. TaxID=1972610 RepID=UPI0031C18841|nr:hypothetical protein [Xanthomonadaceae bacterium]
MKDKETIEIPKSASVASLAIALLTAVILFIAWGYTGRAPFLVAGIGFIVVSPIWFLSPIDYRTLFGPVGGRTTYHRKFTPAQGLLSLVGYAMIFASIVIWLIQSFST